VFRPRRPPCSGHDDLMTTARTDTHVVADERELDYSALLIPD
jgi:hypothetical protein